MTNGLAKSFCASFVEWVLLETADLKEDELLDPERPDEAEISVGVTRFFPDFVTDIF